MSISVERHVAKAKQAVKKGNIDLAKKFYSDILDAFPNNARVREALDKLDTGSTGKIRPSGSNLPANLEQLGQLFRQNRYGDAISLGQTLLRKYPRSYDVYNILGAANSMLDRRESAVDCFSKALQINPNSADVHNNLGNALRRTGRQEEAVECYNKALRLDPKHYDAHNNLGIVHKSGGELHKAIKCFSRALEISPKYANAHFNLGNAYQDLGQYRDAVGCYEQAIGLKPDYAKAYENLGNAYQGLSQHRDAVRCYEQVICLKPDYAKAYQKLCSFHYLLRDLEAARTNINKALQILPDDTSLKMWNLEVCAQLCDWDTIYSDRQFISTLGISDDHVPIVTILSLEDAPARHRARLQRFAKRFSQIEMPEILPPVNRPDRVRIGYFSAEFHAHACMYLTARLFEIHDREQFSLHAFSYGPDTNNPIRDRLKPAFDEFHEVQALTDKQVAELAREHGIDIAVHISGYTKNHRTGIFAYRAAPIQISYLGYPGTLGAPYIDYLITDNVVVPPEQRAHYTEKLICLPNTYMASDNTREISERPISRAEMELPEQGFVFCCFNAKYKITPYEFDIWMRLLRNVEDSILWLRQESDESAQSIRYQASRRNVDPNRIVFAQRMPSLSEHLARHRLADLFLDTFNYNAHTTASDALWAGLPVVTKVGQGFAARVAASLLTAIDVPELITSSADEYEALALELATNPEKLRRLRSKLHQNRNRTPLFDTEMFARHIESGYQQAYQLYFDGKPSHDIFVEGNRTRRGVCS